MTKKSEIGKIGEDFACTYLYKKGYRIINRNYLTKIGEIDIIGIDRKDRNKTLVFFEIKTMQKSGNPAIAGLAPEDNMTKSKIKKVARTCELFISANPKLISEEKGWRIDLLAVSLDENLKPEFTHYENIFL